MKHAERSAAGLGDVCTSSVIQFAEGGELNYHGHSLNSVQAAEWVESLGKL